MKKKITAVILSLVLLLSQSSIFAVGLDVIDDVTADNVSEPEILAEDVSKRDEFEKHFLLSDGSFIAVTYDNAVHYKDADGKWQDVDNKVIYNAKSGKYVTSTPTFNAEFRAAGAKDSLVTLKNGESSIAWGLSVVTPDKGTMGTIDANDTVTPITGSPAETVTLKNAVSEKSDKKYDLTNVVGGIGYTNIFGNAPEISVDYSVSHNRIEEDIYINSPTDATAFKMELYIGELVAAVNSDGSVSITDSEGNEEYRIGIPYMADANDAVLTNIDVTVTQNDGNCTVTYTPDKNWLTSEDRAYPILFDPSITTSEYAANVYDTYVYQGNTANHSGEQRLYIGVMNSKVYRTYITFGKLPSIDSTMPIISASLTFTMHYTTTTGKTTGLYKLNSGWNQSSITYANAPTQGELIGTSAYNASTNKHVFDLTDYIHDMYDEHQSDSFNGFLFRYVDETLTNPDYNAPYSSEVSTRAYRPALTVVYGYSLPADLNTNNTYAFKNYGSLGYMTVFGGTDTNDVNVTQTVKNSSALTNADKFKLVQAANGGYYIRAVCSSNNRVLDIYKNDATGYVENGCNVQIYNPTDPLAQEWFIVGAENGKYKIIPRTDMSLALASNSGSGSANGRAATSAGNVYVSTYTGADNQLWMIYDCTQEKYVNSNSGIVSDGVYYLNNKDSGRYLRKIGTSNTVTGNSGMLADLGDSIKWQITYVRDGGYIIRPYSDPTKYLGVGGSAITLFDLSDSTIPDNCLWTIRTASGGGVLIQNLGTDLYMAYTAAPLLYSDLPSSNDDSYYKYVWRLADTNTYGNSDNHSMKELDSSAYMFCNGLVGKEVSFGVISEYEPLMWVGISDFELDYDDNIAGYLEYVNKSTYKGIRESTVELTVKHKITGLVIRLYLNIDGLLVYQSPNTYYADSEGSIAEDVSYNDKNLDEMKSIIRDDWEYMLYMSSEQLRVYLDYACDAFSEGNLQVVASDMVDKFMNGNTYTYSNSVLTSAVQNHETTETYVEHIEGYLLEFLSNANNDIESLEYDVDTRSSSYIVCSLDEDKQYQPSFNSMSDLISGLVFCVHSLWGNEISIVSYENNGEEFSCTIRYTLYDHFGLDENDVTDYALSDGFCAWYILQHYEGFNGNHKPFLTLMSFETTITGEIGD